MCACKIYCNMEVHSSHFSLGFSLFNCKTFFLQLEVGMGYKALHNESNTKYFVMKMW